MTNKNTTYGGATNYADGDVLPAADLLDTQDAIGPKWYQENTETTHTGDTSETTMATLTIAEDDLGDNGTIDVQFTFSGGGTGNVTWRIKVGGSTVFTYGPKGASSNFKTLRYVSTGVDTTSGSVDVTITVQKSGTGGTETFVQAVMAGYSR